MEVENAAPLREGPRVRIPVPFKAVIGWSALSTGRTGPACRESPSNPRVLSTWSGPAPRQVDRDGSPVGGCASSAGTGVDGRGGGPEVREGRGLRRGFRRPLPEGKVRTRLCAGGGVGCLLPMRR